MAYGVYDPSGATRVTVVDGSALTGLYAADGSLNVVVSNPSIYSGVYHACGALNVTVTTTQTGRYAANGSLYVAETNGLGALYVIAVSGDFGGLSTPELTWVSTAADNTPLFSVAVGIGILVEDDDWVIQLDDNTSFTSPVEVTGTVNAADALDGEIDAASGTVIPDGLTYARFRVLRDAVPVTNWSNTASETINAPPVMTSAATFNVTENTTTVGTLTADQASTFAIGGTDAAFFQITGGNLLSFVSAPDFEAPADAGANNVYDITITPTATHDSEAGVAQSIAVTVVNDSADDFADPTDIADLALWLDPSDLTTLFQEMAGSTPVTTTGQNVGKANDKSGTAFDLTARADDATRPTYNTAGGLHWVNFHGQTLRRDAALNLYNSGDGYSIFFALRSNMAGFINRYLIGEGNSANTNTIWAPIKSDTTTPTIASTYLRNDAAFEINNHTLDTANVFDNTDRVFAVIDDGAGNFSTYVDGVLALSGTYTRTGVVTVDRFTLSGLIRTVFQSNSEFQNTRVYQLAIYNRAVNASERAEITTYVGAKAGLTL
jgi:hypothetical protein